VRKQDAITGLRYSLAHSSSFIHAYDFIKAKWNDILNKYAGFSFSALVSDIANKLKHENLLTEVIKLKTIYTLLGIDVILFYFIQSS